MTMKETIRKPDYQSWWPNLIRSLNIEDLKLRQRLLELNVVRESDRLYIIGDPQNPNQRTEAYFMTINFNFQSPVIAWNTNETPKFHYISIPGLPWKEITRNGRVNKTGWFVEDY